MTTGTATKSNRSLRRFVSQAWVWPKSEMVYARIMRTFDRRGFEELKRRCYATRSPDRAGAQDAFKYLNIAYYLRQNIRLGLLLGLDRTPPARTLDIGSGAGYFSLVCRHFGHEPLGMDRDKVAVFNETCRFLGIPRVIASVEPMQALAAFDTSFDLITAISFVFNHLPDKSYWTLKEWAYFIDDARSRLNPGGRLFLGAVNRIGANAELQAFLRHAPGFETHSLSHYEFVLARRD